MEKGIQKTLKEFGEQLLAKPHPIRTKTWQGIDATDLGMLEIRRVSLTYAMPLGKEALALELNPNLPWAENHFQERISGQPLNPGEEYKNWPYYRMDEKMRNVGEKFSHSYMERFWPKNAWDEDTRPVNGKHVGIRFEYGDLQDVIMLLRKDRFTRQAYLPVWFPEDTGVVHGKRVPCTLGYLFSIRDNCIDITYYIRSCDYVRHLRDDIYLAVRLAQYVKSQIDLKLKMGTLLMHIENLHCFSTDTYFIKKQLEKM